MATTFALIRDQQAATIAALTPSSRSDIKFVNHLAEAPFLAWVESNVNGCIRRFFIRNNFDIEIGPTSDGSLEWFTQTETVLVAYPEQWALYGAGNEYDADDFIEADLRSIDSAIGRNGSANYVSTQHVTELVGSSIERVPGAIILAMSFKTQYDRST